MAKYRKNIRCGLAITAMCVLLAGCGNVQENGALTSSSENLASSEESVETGAVTEASKEVFAMDTFMTLRAYGELAQKAVDAAAEEIERLDQLWSTGSESSEVSQLNVEAGGTMSEETQELVMRALEVYESTSGAFDITIYPIMQLWGFTSQEYAVPEETELTETMALVGSEYLKVEENQLVMTKEGTQIDLGGIAKGYTSTKVMQIFASYGIESAVISLGGNVQVLGSKTDGSAWRVAVADPEDETAYIGVLQVKNQAVITSGGYERYFEEDGMTYHHIIDPATGYPAENGLKSVTIVSEDGTLADALSTSLYVMGTEKAMEYCKEHMVDDGFGAVLYDEEGTIYVTENIAEEFETDNDITVIYP